MSLPSHIGQYEILALAGEGTKGLVYRARQCSMDRVVAVKVLRHEYACHEEYVQRFHNEARLSGRIPHAHLLQVYEVGEHGGAGASVALPFFSMEFVEGCTLRDSLLRHGPLDEAAAIDLGLQIGSALLAVHDHGLLHRDVKPDNILLDANGHAKLADLGLAMPIGSCDETPGKVRGTPAYVAPEMIRQGLLDGRADLYGLGATLFHLLTGELVFPASDVKELFDRHLQAEPRRLRSLRPDCSPGLDELVAALLAKRPDDRPDDARTVLHILHHLLGTPWVEPGAGDSGVRGWLKKIGFGAA